jgi:hypothetical protein
MIKLSIDVSKIDKDKLYKGKKGTYLNVALIDTPDNQYGNDFMVVQDIPKEDREAGQKGAILGNGKNWDAGQRPKDRHAEETQQEQEWGTSPQKQEEDTADLPF